jgi:hypothetical protein
MPESSPCSTLAAALAELYDDILQQQPMTEVHLRAWAAHYHSCKESWQDQYPLPSGLEDVLSELDYILDRLLTWASKEELVGNRDARVFLDALTGHTVSLQALWGSPRLILFSE